MVHGDRADHRLQLDGAARRHLELAACSSTTSRRTRSGSRSSATSAPAAPSAPTRRFRRNTWWDNGTQFADKPDLQWGLDGGSNNLWERNLVVSKLNFSSGAGFAQSGTTARDNLVGGYAMNAIGECTAAACNPAGAEPIGYRKPAGVHW